MPGILHINAYYDSCQIQVFVVTCCCHVGVPEKTRRFSRLLPQLGQVQGRIRRRGWWILARWVKELELIYQQQSSYFSSGYISDNEIIIIIMLSVAMRQRLLPSLDYCSPFISLLWEWCPSVGLYDSQLQVSVGGILEPETRTPSLSVTRKQLKEENLLC